MIAEVEVNDVTFTVDYDYSAEQASSLYDPGEPASVDFKSVTIKVDKTEIDIWECLNESTLNKIEDKIWETIQSSSQW